MSYIFYSFYLSSKETICTLFVLLCIVITCQAGPEEVCVVKNGNIELKCFDDQERPRDEDIESYGWKIGNIASLIREPEIKEYPEYSLGARKGDIIINKVEHELNVYCVAMVKGGQTETKRKEYSLKFGTCPSTGTQVSINCAMLLSSLTLLACSSLRCCGLH